MANDLKINVCTVANAHPSALSSRIIGYVAEEGSVGGLALMIITIIITIRTRRKKVHTEGEARPQGIMGYLGFRSPSTATGPESKYGTPKPLTAEFSAGPVDWRHEQQATPYEMDASTTGMTESGR